VRNTTVYRRYTKGWRSPRPNIASDSGGQDLIPGPLLRARVGDRLLVHFKNLEPAGGVSHSMYHDHSRSMDASIEGGMYGMLSILRRGERAPDREFVTVFAPMGSYHGHRWTTGGVPRDTVTLGPAESTRIRWKENDAGTWLYHCHVESHMAAGMIGVYQVSR
jgi:FtsP/CotA-like multicopper oxidase with cupredoxin domain